MQIPSCKLDARALGREWRGSFLEKHRTSRKGVELYLNTYFLFREHLFLVILEKEMLITEQFKSSALTFSRDFR